MDKIAERYAQSFFDLALENKSLDAYTQDMKLVETVLESDPAFVAFFSHVLIADEVKYKLLDESFGSSIDHMTLNFLKLLVKKRRIRYIKPIVKAFIVLSNKELGIEEGLIFSPYELNEHQVKDIEKAISKKEKKVITLRVIKDPDLIGGVKVQIANRVYDGSIKNKVNRLKEELIRK